MHSDKTGEAKAIAMTQSAINKQRERERLIREAKTEQERQAVMKESKIVRYSFVFDGEEGKIVKAVLGKNAAVRLLEICKEIYAKSV